MPKKCAVYSMKLQFIEQDATVHTERSRLDDHAICCGTEYDSTPFREADIYDFPMSIIGRTGLRGGRMHERRVFDPPRLLPTKE